MPAAHEKVLLVEDEPDIRDVTAEFLASLGYEVCCASSGDEAVKFLEADRSLALLLTDINMPGTLHGFALARLAKTIRPDLRVLYVSGHDLPDGDAIGALHGPIMRKPYRLFKLAEEIKRVLEQAEAGTATARAAERQALYDLESARLETAQYREDGIAHRAAVDRAGSSNRAKTRLLAEVGHDLRQPLTVITANLEMLAARLGEHDQRTIARIGAAARRLDRGLSAIMDAARLELGGIEPKVQVFPIGPLLAEVGDQHEEDARRKRLGFKVVASRARVASDPTLLASLLHNLVENAIKYTERGRVVLGCRRRGERLLINVVDTGIGIAPDLLEAIFDEYRRLDPTRGAGVGLGLAIAKRTADLLEHRLSVSSTVDEGSCFCVEVPLEDASARARAAAAAR